MVLNGNLNYAIMYGAILFPSESYFQLGCSTVSADSLYGRL